MENLANLLTIPGYFPVTTFIPAFGGQKFPVRPQHFSVRRRRDICINQLILREIC